MRLCFFFLLHPPNRNAYYVMMKLTRGSPLRNVRFSCPHRNLSQNWPRLYATQWPRNPNSPMVSEEDSVPTDEHERPVEIDSERGMVETAVGHLPLSPVMDPKYWMGRNRNIRKAISDKAENPLERQLRKNAFANALATPIRKCKPTQTHLPRFFLQDFALVSHPDTGKPWWVPRDLAPKGPIEDERPEETAEEWEEGLADETTKGNEDGVRSDRFAADGPSGYILARRDLFSFITQPGSGYQRASKSLLPGFSNKSVYGRAGPMAVWREDMDVFLLDMYRRDIYRTLLHFDKLCAQDRRKYIVKFDRWSDIMYEDKGALLWFPSELDNSQSQAKQFSTYEVHTELRRGPASASLPVHNIPALLGPELAQQLRQEAQVLNDGSIFLCTRRRTTKFRMKLWKLEGYIADYSAV
ncbi:hypothetical protein F4780DRAFT_714827 [Xylariomycetidae sp. FL0641]|nr:hypothetical protein F4780DRAFT_714827 [Xylariomycetidae sp. FL0641]